MRYFIVAVPFATAAVILAACSASFVGPATTPTDEWPVHCTAPDGSRYSCRESFACSRFGCVYAPGTGSSADAGTR